MDKLLEIANRIQEVEDALDAYENCCSRILKIEFDGVKPHTEMTIYAETGKVMGTCNAWEELPKEITDSLSSPQVCLIKKTRNEMRKITTTNEEYCDGICALFVD